MKQDLVYTDAQDGEFFSGTVVIPEDNKTPATVRACTIAGSREKANEDSYAVWHGEDIILSAVFDGVTSLKVTPGLVGITGARFASHFLRDALSIIFDDETLAHGLLELNQRLLRSSTALGVSVKDILTLPSSMATIVRLNLSKSLLEMAHVGDSFCILYNRDGTSEVISNDLNDKFDKSVFGFMQALATDQGITPREARRDPRVQEKLLEMSIGRNNNPNGSGSGVVNGLPELSQYIQSVSLPLDNARGVLIGSDGLMPVNWSLESAEDRERLFNIATSEGLSELIKAKHRSEDADPDWRYLRYKHSDDATAVVIAF